MKYMEELKSKLKRVIEEISRKQDISASDLDKLQKLTDVVKNLDKITMLESEGGYSRESGYSQNGDWEAEMRGRYDRDASYAGRRRHYVRGHYSRDGEGGNGGSGGNGGGYSRHGDDIRERIQDMMEDAGSEKEREVLRRCVEML